MCQCTLCADRFLRGLLGCADFAEYCRRRHIRLPARLADRTWDEVIRWWTATLRGLPDEVREQVEWEQLAVPELATPSGCLHLLTAAGWRGPPPAGSAERLPRVLRLLLDQPSVFREVYRRHSHREPDVWRAARAAAGLSLPEPDQVEVPLVESLGRLLRELTGGRSFAVTTHRIPGAIYVSARPPGKAAGTLPMSDPSLPTIDFVYYASDGTVLLRTPGHAAARAREVLDCLSRSALGSPAVDVRPAFALERLKEPFRPLPDSGDVLSARVKTLHLRYPGRCGRRELRLETQTSDSPSAVEEMFRDHAGHHAEELCVSYAVVQVRMRLEGCEKTHLVRLWPDRCDAGDGPVRTRVLASLRSWGL